MFSWFDTKEVDEFVDRMIADLQARVPVASLDRAKGPARLEKAHDELLRAAMVFARDHRPNLFKKARMASRFKWGLQAAGYPKDFVDAFALRVASVTAAAHVDREI